MDGTIQICRFVGARAAEAATGRHRLVSWQSAQFCPKEASQGTSAGSFRGPGPTSPSPHNPPPPLVSGRGHQGTQRHAVCMRPVCLDLGLYRNPPHPLATAAPFGSLPGFDLPGFDLWGTTGVVSSLSDTQFLRLTLLLREYGTCWHPWSATEHHNHKCVCVCVCVCEHVRLDWFNRRPLEPPPSVDGARHYVPHWGDVGCAIFLVLSVSSKDSCTR